MTKWLLIIALIFIPLYLLRLSQVPEYKIPEGAPVRLIGRVSQQPYLKGSNQIINVGPALMVTNRFPGYFYGQKLEVTGTFDRRVINPFLAQFIAYYPTIRLVEKTEDSNKMIGFRRILFNIRGLLEKTVNQLLAEPHSSLLNGILLGAKKEMPQEFWQNLRETGTLHIVVASGQNVTMVARFLIGVLVWLMNRRKALFFAVLGVILYVLMVGAGAPVVRAGIMAIVAYTAQFLGRQEEGMLALLLAAILLLLISPLVSFDIGFQLSFAATAGILWLYPQLKKKKAFSLPVVGEGLATTIAAQLGAMPILLTNFGQISILSPLINALLLWTVPIVMVLGFFLVLLALIIKPLAYILSWFVWLLLTYFIKIIEIASRLPWISLKIGQLSFWWGIGYYFVLGYFVQRSQRRTQENTPGVKL